MKVEGKLSGRTKETTRGEGEGEIAGYGGGPGRGVVYAQRTSIIGSHKRVLCN